MRATNVNGTNLYVRFAGRPEGDPLVLVNSLGTDWRVWEPAVEALGERYRLLYYDKRGHGLSDARPAPSTIDDHVNDLAALLDHLGIPRAIVCGLSVGGMIAMGLAARRPEMVGALVLADTGHLIGTDDRWNQRIETIQGDGMEAIVDGVLEVWFTDSFRRQRSAETALWRNMLLRTPVEGYLGTCAAVRDADLTGPARGLTVPALCLCGARDASTPPSLMRELNDLIPDSRFQEIPDAAHLPTVEAPEVVQGLIEDYLQELGFV